MYAVGKERNPLFDELPFDQIPGGSLQYDRRPGVAAMRIDIAAKGPAVVLSEIIQRHGEDDSWFDAGGGAFYSRSALDLLCSSTNPDFR